MAFDVAHNPLRETAPGTMRTSRGPTYRRMALAAALGLIAAVWLVWQESPKNAISVIHGPSQEMLRREGVFQWGPWARERSEFDWYFSEPEKAYVLEGEAYITPEGSTETVVVRPGDYIRFEPGLRSHWRVTQPFRKLAVGEPDAIGAWRWELTWRMQSAFRRLTRLVQA